MLKEEGVISGQPPKRAALHDPSQAHLEGALPAFGDVQSPPVSLQAYRRAQNRAKN